MFELELLDVKVYAFDLQLFARDVQTVESQLAARRDIDYDEDIARYIASTAPITILTRKLAKEKCQDPEFHWFEEDILSCWDAINNAAGYLSTDTALIVDNPSYFTPWDVVKVPRTGEQMLVTAINDGTSTLTVRRGFGSTAAAALVDDDPLFIVGNAHAEGGSRADINQQNVTDKSNYCQIFKHACGVTGTEEASKQRGVKEMDRLRLDKLLEHNRAIEQAFFFGEPKLYTTGEVRRTTGGVIYFNNVNSKDFGGATTWAEVEEGMETAFGEGSDTKVAFCAPTVVSVLDQLAANKLQVAPDVEKYGIKAKRLITSHGELIIVKHKLLKGAIYGNYAFILDMKYLKYRYLRDTKLETNVQTRGDDKIIDQYITECGLQMKLPKAHMVWKNITSAA